MIINEGDLDASGNGLIFYHNNTGTYFIDNGLISYSICQVLQPFLMAIQQMHHL